MATDILPFGYALKKPPKKIAVAMVSHEMVPMGFTYDLAALTMHSVATLGEGWEYGLRLVKGTYVHAARQQMLQQLIEDKVDYILWVDTDMRFPRDSLIRLLDHNLPIVGINYCNRGEPYNFVALKKISWEKDGVTERCLTLQKSTGLEEVEAMGFGMILMKTEILSCLPSLDEKPWFWFEWIEGRRQVGEDVYFCNLLKQGGHRLFVDHDLSKLCAHQGLAEYECIHAERYGFSTPESVKAAASAS